MGPCFWQIEILLYFKCVCPSDEFRWSNNELFSRPSITMTMHQSWKLHPSILFTQSLLHLLPFTKWLHFRPVSIIQPHYYVYTIVSPAKKPIRIIIPLARNSLYTKMLLHPKTCVVPVLPSKFICSSLLSRIVLIRPASSLVIPLFFICLYLRPFPRCLLINRVHSNTL